MLFDSPRKNFNTSKTFSEFVNECSQYYKSQQLGQFRCREWTVVHFEHEETMSNYSQCFLLVLCDDKSKGIEILEEVEIILESKEDKVVLIMLIHGISKIGSTMIAIHCVHPMYKESLNLHSEIFVHKSIDEVLKDKVPILEVVAPSALEPMDIITQYSESNLNFMNRLLFRIGLPWKCNEDGTAIASKDLMLYGKEIPVEEVFFQPVSLKMNRLCSKLYGYNVHHPMDNESIPDPSIFHFVNEISSEMKDQMNAVFHEFHAKNFAYAMSAVRPKLFDKAFFHDREFFITKIFYSSDERYRFYPFYVEMCDKPLLGDFTIPKPGMQVATVRNMFEGPVNFLEEKMSLTAKIHFDKLMNRVPVYFSSTQFSTFNQAFNFPRQNQLILVYFISVDFPVFITSMPNFDNRYRPENFLMSSTGWVMNSVRPCESVIVPSEDPNDTGENEERSSHLIFRNDEYEEKLDIRAQKEMRVTVVEGSYITMLTGEGQYKIFVKKGEASIEIAEGLLVIKVNGDVSYEVDGDYGNKVSGKYSLEASDVVVKADNISFEAANISFTSDAFSIKAAEVNIDSEAMEIVSEEFDLTAVETSMEAGEMEIMAGSLDIEAGDTNILCGDTSMEVGAFEITCGMLDMATGDISIACGMVDMAAGDVSVAGGMIEFVGGMVCIVGGLVNMDGCVMGPMFMGMHIGLLVPNIL